MAKNQCFRKIPHTVKSEAGHTTMEMSIVQQQDIKHATFDSKLLDTEHLRCAMHPDGLPGDISAEYCDSRGVLEGASATRIKLEPSDDLSDNHTQCPVHYNRDREQRAIKLGAMGINALFEPALGVKIEPSVIEVDDQFMDSDEMLDHDGDVATDDSKNEAGERMTRTTDDEQTSEFATAATETITSLVRSNFLAESDGKSGHSEGSASDDSHHENISQSEKPNNFNVCSICRKSFTSLKRLQKHLQNFHSSEPSYKCAWCDKTNRFPRDLIRHMRLHSDKRPYACTTCDKRFQRADLRLEHEREHPYKERVHQCHLCRKRFRTLRILETHVKHHVAEKIFECQTCEKRFKRSDQLRKHAKIHSGKKPYKCALCDLTFSDSYQRREHAKTHDPLPKSSEATSSECTVCGKVLKQKNLTKHMLMHTGERPYKCGKCKRAFRSERAVEQHRKAKHVNDPTALSNHHLPSVR